MAPCAFHARTQTLGFVFVVVEAPELRRVSFGYRGLTRRSASARQQATLCVSRLILGRFGLEFFAGIRNATSRDG